MARGSRSRAAGVVRVTSVVLLIVVCVAVAAVLATRTHAVQAAAGSAARSFTPPAVSTPGPQLVSVISDETSGSVPGSAEAKRDPEAWISIVSSRLSIRLAPFVVAGSGYVRSGPPGSTGGSTYVTRGAEVSAASRVVVFIGGAADRASKPLTVAKSATRAYAAARTIAPSAHLVVVGPAWPDAAPPANLLALRNILRSAARTVGATWVDPLQQGWLRADGSWTDAGVPSAAGQRELGRRMTSVLSAALHG